MENVAKELVEIEILLDTTEAYIGPYIWGTTQFLFYHHHSHRVVWKTLFLLLLLLQLLLVINLRLMLQHMKWLIHGPETVLNARTRKVFG